MKEIQLTQGKVTLVDDGDFEWLSEFKWFAHKDKYGLLWYAETNVSVAYKKRKTVKMHRLICGAGTKETVDHRNGDSLDNRRDNIRKCTHAENIRNSRVRSDSRSGIKGIFRIDGVRGTTWQADIKCPKGKRITRRFKTLEEAIAFRSETALHFHGEFARLT